MSDEIYRQHESRPVLLSPHYAKHVSHMTTEDLHGKGEIAEELAVRDMEIERLRAELSEVKRVRDNCTLVPTDKLKEMQAELAAIKGQIVDPSWVCLDGMSASELAAFDYGNKCCMDALRRILDGEDKGIGTCNEPWESLRRRVLVVASVADKDAERYRWLRKMWKEPIPAEVRSLGDDPTPEEIEAAIDAAMAKGE